MSDRLEIFESSVTSALQQLFKNPRYFPTYPYKTIIYQLLRDELTQG